MCLDMADLGHDAVAVGPCFASHLRIWGTENMKASWTTRHKVPDRKYGPKLRARVLSRQKPELCSFCSFRMSWACSASREPSATPVPKDLSCLT